MCSKNFFSILTPVQEQSTKSNVAQIAYDASVWILSSTSFCCYFCLVCWYKTNIKRTQGKEDIYEISGEKKV